MAAKSASACLPLPASERRCVDVLKQAFGSRFQFITAIAAPHDQIISDEEFVQSVTEQNPEVASQGAFRIKGREKNCVIASTRGARRHLLVSWRNEPRRRCVASWIRTDDPVLAVRYAQLAIEGLEQEDESQRLNELVESFSEQVTSDFEELAWLRELSLRIEHCEVSQDLSVVAESLLPTAKTCSGRSADPC